MTDEDIKLKNQSIPKIDAKKSSVQLSRLDEINRSIAKKNQYTQHPTQMSKLNQKHFVVQNDPYIKRRKIFILIFIFLLLGGGFFYFKKNPKQLMLAQDKMDDFVDFLAELDFRKKSKRIKEPIKSLSNLQWYISEGECEAVVLNGLESLNKDEYDHLLTEQIASCFIYFGSKMSSDMLLESLRKTIQVIPTSDEEGRFHSQSLGEIYLLMIYSAASAYQNKIIDQLLTGRCDKWFMSYSCVAKLLNASFSNSTDELRNAFDQMELKVDNLDSIEKPYFYLAGANLALGNKKNALVHDRFQKAVDYIPSDRIILSKLFLIEWAIAAFVTQDRTILYKISERIKKPPFHKDLRLQRKISILSQLTNPKKERRTLRRFLKHAEDSLLFRDNFKMVNYVGPLSLKWQLTDYYMTLIGQSLEFFSELQSSHNLMTPLRLWRIRALISAGKYKEALTVLITIIDQTHPSEMFMFHHFKGVCLYFLENSKEKKIEALKQFSESLKEKMTWQSLYGKIQILIDLKQVTPALAYLGQMEQFLQKNPSEEGNSWYKLLLGQYLLLSKKQQEALAVFDGLLKGDKHFFAAYENKIELLRAMGKHQEANGLSNQVDILRASVKYHTTKEAISSPMGALAFYYY